MSGVTRTKIKKNQKTEKEIQSQNDSDKVTCKITTEDSKLYSGNGKPAAKKSVDQIQSDLRSSTTTSNPDDQCTTSNKIRQVDCPQNEMRKRKNGLAKKADSTMRTPRGSQRSPTETNDKQDQNNNNQVSIPNWMASNKNS